MKIQWDSKSTSKCFYVSNGVRQGGVLSPFLFAIYLYALLSELSLSGVGCYWSWWFAGAFFLLTILYCYDLVPLHSEQC